MSPLIVILLIVWMSESYKKNEKVKEEEELKASIEEEESDSTDSFEKRLRESLHRDYSPAEDDPKPGYVQYEEDLMEAMNEIRSLKRELDSKEYEIERLTRELEEVRQEKELEESSQDLMDQDLISAIILSEIIDQPKSLK